MLGNKRCNNFFDKIDYLVVIFDDFDSRSTVTFITLSALLPYSFTLYYFVFQYDTLAITHHRRMWLWILWKLLSCPNRIALRDTRLNLKHNEIMLTPTLFLPILCLSDFFVTSVIGQSRVDHARAMVRRSRRTRWTGGTQRRGVTGDRWASRRLTEETAFSLLPFRSFCLPSPCPLWPPFLSS